MWESWYRDLFCWYLCSHWKYLNFPSEKKKNLFSLGSKINTTSNDKNRPDEKGFVYYCLKSDLYTNFLKENESIIKEVALRSLTLF